MRGKNEMWWDGLTVKERMADVAKWAKREKVYDPQTKKFVGWDWRWFPIGCDRDGKLQGPGISALRKYRKIAGFVWSRGLGQGYVQVNPVCYVEYAGKSAKKPAWRKIIDDKMRAICQQFGLFVNVNKWVMEDEALFWVDEPKPEQCEMERRKKERRDRSARIKRLPWKKEEIKERLKAKAKKERREAVLAERKMVEVKAGTDVVMDLLGVVKDGGR